MDCYIIHFYKPVESEKLEGVGIGECKQAWENGGEEWKAVNSQERLSNFSN